MKRNLIPSTIAAGLVLSACASPSAAGRMSHPTDANQVVVRVDLVGGFITPAVRLSRVPSFALYGDGTLLTPGPQIAIFPGPALPNVLRSHVTEAGVQAILQAARQAGLLGPDRRYLDPGVADAGTTVFTVVANGRRHVVSAYALGIGSGGTGMGDAQARKALAAFESKLMDLARWLPKGSVTQGQSFVPSAMLLLVQPSSSTVDVSPGGSSQNWPLGAGLATYLQPVSGFPDLGCGVVRGKDLQTLMPALRRATQTTLWRSGGVEYGVTFRPLLPGETGCADLPPLA